MLTKRIGLLVLALVTAMGLAACSNGNNGGNAEPQTATNSVETGSNEGAEKVNPTGFPIVNETLDVTFFTGLAPIAATDWSQVKLWQEYEKMTNIKVKFDLVPRASLSEKRNLALAGGEYPEAFYQALIPNGDILKYGEQGIFVRLNEYIDNFAPNFKQILDSNPAVRKAITMPDGGIYSFPWIFDPAFTSLTMGPRVWINKDWLDQLGMQEPTTLDEFYSYLKGVKETDLNGNGKSDEIPWSAVGLQQIIASLKGSYGFANRGNSHPLVDVEPGTDQLRFFPADPKYKEMLEFIHMLYKEGLIDRDTLTQKTPDMYAKGNQNLLGTTITVNPRITMKLENYVGAGALKGPHGDQIYSFVNPSVPLIGGFVITDKAKNVEALVRWIDYFYGEEGSRMLMIGFKDVTYKELPDGKFELLDNITNNPDGLSQDQALSKYVTYPGGGAPTIVFQNNYAGGEAQPDSLMTAEKVQPYKIDEVWPTFNFTEEENDRMTKLRSDLYTYVNEHEAKFILGDLPFSQWDKFVAGLKDVKLDEFMEIYNTAYERYKQ
ncbi:extracellular solute-binding protein [Paenibacillus sp. J5C_2022]|uniref:extracellular solute-binding protein n=1 Tax=Paenibacillus sp. J5C2022 TaxID=2977129 RepID=UPI0021D39B6F|nr:extracellular solute-binding protein [Paenibacillus sp. J5C2022]MCU6708380.1 extracellular solute-binding protein [Paenibacillus sp. J5C2022]